MSTKLTSLEKLLVEYNTWAEQLAEDNEPSMRQRIDIATQDQLDHQDAMNAREFDRNQGRIARQRGAHHAGVDIERWLKPYQTLLDNNFKPVETEDRFEYLMQVALKLKGTNAGFSGDTGMSNAARIFNLQPGEQKLVVKLIQNAPKVSELEKQLRSEVSEDALDQKTWMAQIKAKHPNVRFIQAKMPGAPIRAVADGKEVGRFETPKPVNETASRSEEDAKKAYNFIRDNWMDEIELRKYAGTTKSPQAFFQAVHAYREKDSEDRIVTALARAFDSSYTGSTDSPWHARESVNESTTSNRLKFLAGILK